MSEERRHVSYLLRLWQVSDAENSAWRAFQGSPHSGERQAFANLTDLFTFLEKEVCHVVQGQTAPSMGGKGGDIDK